MSMQEQVTYPFTAIVDLGDLKLALILNAVNPKIGGSAHPRAERIWKDDGGQSVGPYLTDDKSRAGLSVPLQPR